MDLTTKEQIEDAHLGNLEWALANAEAGGESEGVCDFVHAPLQARPSHVSCSSETQVRWRSCCSRMMVRGKQNERESRRAHANVLQCQDRNPTASHNRLQGKIAFRSYSIALVSSIRSKCFGATTTHAADACSLVSHNDHILRDNHVEAKIVAEAKKVGSTQSHRICTDKEYPA